MSTTKTHRMTATGSAFTGPGSSVAAHRDLRELVETVVFVLVLVNLLRMFGAEAFVIPTGSMATTLLGAHKVAECPQCGHISTINASDQVENNRAVHSGVCQNCRQFLNVSKIAPTGGDRVLVAKFLYEGVVTPRRWDVVVFKCPEPLKTKTNFIKRLAGRPGETVQIRYGDIFVKEAGASDYAIARKPPKVIDSVRRLVYDNDEQAADLVASGFPPRWAPEESSGWTVSPDRKSFTASGKTGSEPTWLGYRHIIGGGDREGDVFPQLITDFESYNSGHPQSQQVNWTGDLMIDCQVNVPELAGSVVFELVESTRTYQCRFAFDQGTIELLQNGVKIAEAKSPVTSTGAWHVRFANVDERLVLWVEDGLVFGEGIAVEPLTIDEQGPRLADLRPLRIGADRAAVTVSNLRIYRDLYYAQTARFSDYHMTEYPFHFDDTEWLDGKLAAWREGLQSLSDGKAYAIGSDEFFMLGDNSPSSSDGREWEGTNFVKRHLLLGKALLVYWPLENWKFVR